jgi:hypothetical protein
VPDRNPATTDTHADEEETLPTQWWNFDSSRIEAAGYDSGSRRLYVKFHKPLGTGTPWVYEGVSPQEWRNLRRSQSPGRYVNRVLNGKNYHRGDFDV